MCSQKWANPNALFSSMKEPTPTDKLAEDLEALGSEISIASILLGKVTIRNSLCSERGFIISNYLSN